MECAERGLLGRAPRATDGFMVTRIRALAEVLLLSCCVACDRGADSNATTPEMPEMPELRGAQPAPDEAMTGDRAANANASAGAGADRDDGQPDGAKGEGDKPPVGCSSNCP